MVKSPGKCSKRYCRNIHYKMGFCDEHYNEKYLAEKRKELALEFLRTHRLNKEELQCSEAIIAFAKIEPYWDAACFKLRSEAMDSDNYSDYAECVTNICVKMVEIIVGEETKYREGISHNILNNNIFKLNWENLTKYEAELELTEIG